LSAPTSIEIKAQLQTLLAPILDKTLIVPYWILNVDDRGRIDVEVLRSPVDPVNLPGSGTINRVNCLMISEAAFIQGRVNDDETRRISKPIGTNVITRHFRLWYFFQDPVNANAEDTFSTNVELMRTTLNQNPKLGFLDVVNYWAGPGAWIDGHDRLQGPLMLPESMGDVVTFVFEGRLAVRLREALN